MRAAMLAFIALGLSGCSWLFMDRVEPGWEPHRETRCTAVPGFAVWDGAIALTSAVGAVTAIVQDDDRRVASAETASSVGLVAVAAVFAVSSVHGYLWSRRCEETRVRRDEWLDAQREQFIEEGR
jgi:hypothetical protein